jgi:hypothetical protein
LQGVFASLLLCSVGVAFAIEPPATLTGIECRAMQPDAADSSYRTLVCKWQLGPLRMCGRLSNRQFDLFLADKYRSGQPFFLDSEIRAKATWPTCATSIYAEQNGEGRKDRAAYDASCQRPLSPDEIVFCEQGMPVWRVSRNTACANTDRTQCTRPVMSTPIAGREIGRVAEGTAGNDSTGRPQCGPCVDATGATIACRSSTTAANSPQWRMTTATNAARGYALCALLP